MREELLVVGGGDVFEGVAIVVDIVDHKALFACMFVTPNLPQHF